MVGRLPRAADFPSTLRLDIVPPPNNDPPTNILILLHGLGDSQTSFTSLAKQLHLPETACLALRALSRLPELGDGHYHWGDDVMFDSNNDGLDPDAGFNKSTALLRNVVQDVLISQCGYTAREIIFFGFGQGGMAALSLAVALQPTLDELGGIVSIGGPLAGETPASLQPKCRTPVLVCAGSKERSAVTSSSEDKLRRVFESVEVKRYRRPGDGMPGNRDEMLPVMQFFSRRLKSRKGVPAGSVEVGV